MTVDQMRRAIDQVIEQKIDVNRFTFCGGEPILHRDLQQLINEVARLKTLHWGRVLTNGIPATDDLRAKIKMPDRRFTWVPNPLDDPEDPMSGKHDPGKRSNGRYHLPFWISPSDIGLEANFESCSVKGWPGVGLDSSGWSMCGKAVMFGKLFGIDPTIKEGDILEHIETPIQDICKHCQYGLLGPRRVRRRVSHDIDRRYKAGELPAISPTFVKAFKQHSESPLIQLQEF